MSEPHLQHLAALIANDGHAASFQSLGQYRSALLKEIAQASAAPEQRPIQWPKDRDVGRFGDMSQHANMRVGLDNDNDVYVSVYDHEGGANVEFCTQFGGGGKSPNTRIALIALMVAMEQDNADTPSFDWWKRRAAAKPAEGQNLE